MSKMFPCFVCGKQGTLTDGFCQVCYKDHKVRLKEFERQHTEGLITWEEMLSRKREYKNKIRSEKGEITMKDKKLSRSDYDQIIIMGLRRMAEDMIDLSKRLDGKGVEKMNDRQFEMFRMAAARHIRAVSDEMAYFVQIGNIQEFEIARDDLLEFLNMTPLQL